MDRTYGRLLIVQSLLVLANASAVVFSFVSLLKREGLGTGDLVVLNLITFAIAAAGCPILVLARPRSGLALMVLGLLLVASSYAAFLFLHGWPLLVFVGVAWGAYIPSFFLPFNTLAIETTRAENRARKIGGFFLAAMAVGVVAPSLGGFLVDSFGYDVLFAMATGVLLVDAAVLVRLGLGRGWIQFSFDFRSLGRRTTIALLAEGAFEGISFGLAPLIAYSFTTEELSLGGLFSLFAFAGGVVTVIVGMASDRLRRRLPFLAFGAMISALSSLLVVRAATVGEFAVANSVLALTSSIAPVFLFTIAIERMPSAAATAATREVLLNAGRSVSLLASLAIILLGFSVQIAFGLAAISLLFIAFAEPAKSP